MYYIQLEKSADQLEEERKLWQFCFDEEQEVKRYHLEEGPKIVLYKRDVELVEQLNLQEIWTGK